MELFELKIVIFYYVKFIIIFVFISEVVYFLGYLYGDCLVFFDGWGVIFWVF